MSLENSILLMQGVFEDIDKDFTIWEYRKEIKDLLDHALYNHCIDCCCQKSWEALGIKEYTEKSIPEEIEKIMLENERLRLELETRPQGDTFPNPKKNKTRKIKISCPAPEFGSGLIRISNKNLIQEDLL